MASTVTISTTLPYVEDYILEPITTDRLIIRPLLLSDIEVYRTLRSQPEAMAHSSRGRPDLDTSETLAYLQRLQPPYHNSHLYFGIFLKKSNGDEGDLIGDGGVHKFVSDQTGWPEFGYKLKKEYWGCGYATEFAKAFLEFWWSLPRTDARIQIAPSSVYPRDTPRVVEQVYAWTTVDNIASKRVLQKAGFEFFEGLDNGLVNWRNTCPKE